MAGLLRYLLGPGRAEEHHNELYPRVGTEHGRVIAAADGTLRQPARTGEGRWDYSPLAGWLEAPVRAAGVLPVPLGGPEPKPWVHHLSLRLAPEDRHRTLSDQTWGQVVERVLDDAGLQGVPGGCRWLVIRHAADHVHVVTALVREDGAREWWWRDMPKLVDATARAAGRLGLRQVQRNPSRRGDRSGRPGPGELHKARRTGRRVAARDELRTRVRAAAAQGCDPTRFVDLLAGQGVRVGWRVDPAGRRTGIKFALAGDHTAGGGPVWYAGGTLAPDLTWPKLTARWHHTTTGGGRATATVAQVRRIAGRLQGRVDPGPAAAGTADLLEACARTLDPHAGRQLAEAAATLRRTAGGPNPTPGPQLRPLAHALHALRAAADNRDEQETLQVAYELVMLVDRLARLWEQQGALQRARAARSAADRIRAALRPAATTGLAALSFPTRHHAPASPTPAPAAPQPAPPPRHGRTR